MKFILILFFAVLAIASAQKRIRVLHPSHPLHRVAHKDHYYASLGRGDVSSYSRSHDRFNNLSKSLPKSKTDQTV
ncbi:hypothetical protein TNCT_476021 [Trichonephila clavata]|uniref:Uncharacterized protein n=1 Tax=Trichonephila clavata TaxID=2740835 RepID=A0A8X6LNS5_TRICU|nr:hypothetical protein TNCT_476021 [Trichonephila clavata]